MKIMMSHPKSHNNQGSILQIVLIIFMIFTTSISILIFYILQSAHELDKIEDLMTQKNLEILLTKYYSDCVQNDILLSDSYKFQNYQINTIVDDFGDYYEITTNIDTPSFQYEFLIKMDVNTGVVLKFEYL